MNILRAHSVSRTGTGRPLVFVHGYGCDQSVWRQVAGAFPDHQVVLYDIAGCGAAQAGRYDRVRHATLQGHADDLLAICDELQLDRPVLVAHSVGALIGVLAARRRPELFDSMVLLAPSPSYLNDGTYRGGFDPEDIEGLLETLASNHFGWARMMAPVIMGNDDRPALAQDLGNRFCRMDASIAAHFARVTFLADHRADLPGVAVPTLLLQCQDDALAQPAIGAYMHGAMAQSRLLQLEATGHCPHMSAPAEVIAVLRLHLAARAAAPPAPVSPVAVAA